MLKYLPGARRLYIDAVAAARDAKILDPWGAPLERCAGHGEEILFADLDLTRVAEVRNSMKLLDQRRPDVYGTFIEGVDWEE